MAVIKVENVQNFESLVDEKSSKGNLLVVHFWTSWAPQCKQISDVMQLLSTEATYTSVGFLEVEAENLPELSQKYGIKAVPTCIFIKNQKEITRVNGANVPELNKRLQEHSQKGLVIPSLNVEPKQDLNSKLKRLINQSGCVLFMKGNADEPRCGFSKKIVEILKGHNTDFSTFDILGDDEVRQGLKSYSNWPTYPQLYIKGELIGGLDIVKEMEESAELAALLPKKENLDDKLKGLISKAPIMIFIKGKPDAPRCGFSKTLIEILNETGVKYGSFDILQDEEVRQGLKSYSNWPTFPQVYVNGELIGGLDIIKELKAAGELAANLNVKQQ